MSKKRGWHKEHRRRVSERNQKLDAVAMQLRQRAASPANSAMSRSIVIAEPASVAMARPFPNVRVSGNTLSGPSARTPSEALDRIEAEFTINHEEMERAFRIIALRLEQAIGRSVDQFDIVVPWAGRTGQLKVTWHKKTPSSWGR